MGLIGSYIVGNSKRRRQILKPAPGKAYREAMTIVQMMELFPTEEAATEWYESVIWPDGRHCRKCDGFRTREAFVDDITDPKTVVYADDARACQGIPNPHKTVKHSVSEYVNGMAHANGIESF